MIYLPRWASALLVLCVVILTDTTIQHFFFAVKSIFRAIARFLYLRPLALCLRLRPRVSR